ncbi:MAG TPA: tetratricopeptide repeat protein [Tepidisphaeraceae bacterium]|nr:tetratricopeptide repeat protein [Tepidisphaeraceae bacterium]
MTQTPPEKIGSCGLRPALTIIAFCGALLVSFAKALADDDLTSRTIPGKWFEPMVPETDPPPQYPDYYAHDLLAQAQMQLDAGQYRRALVTASQIDPKKYSPVDIAIIKATALNSVGREGEALTVLNAPGISPNPRAQILRAEILCKIEEFPQAIDLLKLVIAHDPTSVQAHYDLGWCYEQASDVTDATIAYQWFVDPPQSFIDQWSGHQDTFTDPAEVVTIGRALGRWAAVTTSYQANPQLHNLILSMFVKAYDRIDRGYEPAHVAAAEYFYSHDDAEEANQELSQALESNPHDIEALKLAGRMALDQYNFAGAEAAATAIRRVDPNSVDADLLEARDLLLQQVPKMALVPIGEALDRQPRNIEALGLLAGAQALLLHNDDCKQTLAEADSIAPASPVAYFEVAEQLGGMRQYPQAEAMYKIALSRAPWWNAVRNGMGLLMTQSGDEFKARIMLEAAHAIDPFNEQTTNYLRLLDMMDKFAQKETAHFIVSYDPKLDPVIPLYFSDYLESIYNGVCGDFDYYPKVKTLIEVFPSHDAFSVRTTGAPWIATVGACTGRVIALVSPRDDYGASGPFNWAQVTRHEFTHTVTLGATDFRISHWFTEGLAVWEEHAPLQWEWVPMLQYAVNTNTLFPLDKLSWAFIRPKKPSDRSLAYAESFWIVTYIQQTYGHQAILDLLTQSRLGHDENQAFQTVFHKPATQFFSEFEDWARKQVATWGYDKATSDKYAKLVTDAQALIDNQDYADAATKWQEIVKLRPMDMMPHQKLMGLYLQLNEYDQACGQLEILSRVELKNNRYVKVLARIYEKEGKLNLAYQRALKAVYINPYDPAAHELLERIDEETGNKAGVAREKIVMPILDKWLQGVEDSQEMPDAPPPPSN